MSRVARVALDSPLPQLDRVFEYEVPESMRARVAPGIRVKVPVRVGGRVMNGWVLELADEQTYAGELAELDSIVSEAEVLTRPLAALAREVADRQAGTLADVLRLAIPARSARLEAGWLADESGERRARAEEARSSASRRAHERDAAGADAEQIDLARRIALRAPTGMGVRAPRALERLAELAAETLAQDRSAIVLVPDARDLDLMLAALDGLAPAERIRRFDSRLTPKPRYDEYLRALEPVPQIIVGTRHAVWAPAHRLGRILMWDDGDESYREPRAPYPHTREVALMRASADPVGLVLAAHAPSLETQRLVRTGFLDALVDPQLRPPRIIPTAAVLGDDPALAALRIPSAAWSTAREALTIGPVLVQVGRAGYRPTLACRRCRTAAHCRECGGRLGQHSPTAIPACTVCGALHADWACDECGATELRATVIGHTRTAEELGRAFPGVPIVIADAERHHVAVPATPQLVVATRGAEPVAEGGYAAVLLLDAETALARESLDTIVDAVRAWSNAAALAAPNGRILITGPASAPIEALQRWRQDELADHELDQRRALDFPPAARLVAIRGTRREVDAALRRLRDLGLDDLQVLGPAPDPDEPDRQRAIVRFAYRQGRAIAEALKAELVAAATASRRRTANRKTGSASTLRVHFDEPDVF